MDHPLDGARAKLRRARKHLSKLKVKVDEFFQDQPYRFFSDRDASTGEEVIRVRVTRNPPGNLGLLVGDVVHNLRASLDHAAYQLVLIAGTMPTDTRKARRVGFPIYGTLDEYLRECPTSLPGMPRQLMYTDIYEFQPCCELNSLPPEMHPFRIVHLLDILDKHKLLILLNAAGEGTTVTLEDPPKDGEPPATVKLVDCGRNQPLIDGAEVARVTIVGHHSGPPRTMKVKARIHFEIVFAEIPFTPKCTALVVPFLQDASVLVGMVLDRLSGWFARKDPA